ncbi:MAG: tyrosine-protein phosphatase [Bacteroidales bacterium]|nr:tyrosine-protein phosphatase [Bacteroidales bacterium]
MKLSRLLVLAALVLLTAGCTVHEVNVPEAGVINHIICNIENFEPESATKVSWNGSVSTWEAGDHIGVFPDMGGSQVAFTVASGAGTGTCVFDGQGWGLISASRYSAYYPFDPNNLGEDAMKNVKVSYSGQSQTAKNTFCVGRFDYLASTNATPVFTGNEPSGTCTFDFKHLGALLILDVTFPGDASLTTMELINTGNNLFTRTGTVDLTQESAAITPKVSGNTLALDLGGMPVAAGETIRFYMMSAPGELGNPVVRVTTDSGIDMTKQLHSSYTLRAGMAYSIAAAVEFVENDGLPRTIHDGDNILVTDPTVEQFLTEVHYPTNDYTYTGVLDYPVAPGNSDIPPSFTIRWYEDVTEGSIVARLWEEGWSRECTLSPSDGNYWIVTNLRPNAHYHYRISTSGGRVLTEGEFDTYGHLHQVFFDSTVRNARDLGGWTTADSKTVKYRKLYRGGKMSPKHLTAKGKQDLLAEGIRAQLDLRGTDKIESCAFGSGYDFLSPGFTAGYLTMLGTDAEKTKASFEFIVNCLRENKPVYFHCSAGRDRTGTMAMLLLGVLGVPEGDISQEYELSLFAPQGWSINEGETTVQTRLVSYKTTTTHLWNLAHGGTFAQGVENYLLSIGVSASDINDLRTLMLD